MGLVGLPEVKTFVEDIVKKAEVYRYGGVKPPHMIISLAAGNGQSVVTDYITDTFYENKVRSFRSFDKSLEYRVKEDADKLRIPDDLKKIIENSDHDKDKSDDDIDDDESETDNKNDDDEEEYFDISDLFKRIDEKIAELEKGEVENKEGE